MSQYTFEDYEKRQTQNQTKLPFDNNKKKDYKVSFFKLSDGESALVRFYGCDEKKDIEIIRTHDITINGIHRRIKCLRDIKDPIDNCPFCKMENPVSDKVYMKLLQYTTNPDGTIKTEAKIFERPMKFVKEKLIPKINSGYILSDELITISRTGKGASDTIYGVEIAPPTVYKRELYPKDFSDFENYKAEGHAYLSKNLDDVNVYLKDGNFPMKQKDNKTVEEKVEVKSNVVEEKPVVKTVENSSESVLEQAVRAIPQQPTERVVESQPVDRPRRTYSYD